MNLGEKIKNHLFYAFPHKVIYLLVRIIYYPQFSEENLEKIIPNFWRGGGVAVFQKNTNPYLILEELGWKMHKSFTVQCTCSTLQEFVPHSGCQKV